MTNQITITQTLERARGLLPYLADHRLECEPSGPGAAQLRNMVAYVKSMEEWVADSCNDPTNAVKRLKDFSKTIERLKVAPHASSETRDVLVQLTESLRFAAEQLDARGAPATVAPVESAALNSAAA